MVHDITDPYFAEVVRGVEDGASSAGYLVITCSSERDADRERSYVRLLRSIRAAAVVFAGSGLDDPAANEEMDRHLAAMRADGAAVVHLSPHAAGEPEVGVDNEAGVASMVAALVGLGHRRIAFLAGPASLFVARGAAGGLPARPGRRGHRRRRPARSGRPASTRRPGVDAVDTLLAGGAPFTAICCANDLLALGALQRLAELGIDVPGAMSVAGFDDISTAAITAPSLSTVRLPLRELGRRGFEHVDRGAGRRRAGAGAAADGGRPARLDRGAGGHGVDARRRRPDGRRARRSRRPRHREQPGHRRRGRGQGRRRGRDRRGPLPPRRPTRPPRRSRGSASSARRPRRSTPTSATARRPRAS